MSLNSKELEKKLGLERVLKLSDPSSHHCAFCKSTEIHQEYDLSWTRHYEQGVGFRQNYQIRVCGICKLTNFIQNTWCDELDEFDYQALPGDYVEHNYNREPDDQKTFGSNYTIQQVVLLEELKTVFSDAEIQFVEEVFVAGNSGLTELAAIGIRSIIEKFYYLYGTNSARDKFTRKVAKENDGTERTKNEYKYKLAWLIQNGLITEEQSRSLRYVIEAGNAAAHTMNMVPKNSIYKSKKRMLSSAITTVLALTIQFKQSLSS